MSDLIVTENGFRVEGRVSFDNVVALRFQGEKLLSKNITSRDFLIDLSCMKEQDASPFSLLLCWQRLARKNKQVVKFVNLSPSMQRMQKMFGLII